MDEEQLIEQGWQEADVSDYDGMHERRTDGA